MAATHLLSIYDASAVLAPVSCTLVYLPHHLSSRVLIADISATVRNAFTNSSSFVDALQTGDGYISSCTFLKIKLTKKLFQAKQKFYCMDVITVKQMLCYFNKQPFCHVIKETI